MPGASIYVPLDYNDKPLIYIAQDPVTTATAITYTARTAIPATPLDRRVNLLVRNTGSTVVYIGGSTVTASGSTKGIPLEADESIPFTVGTVPLYAICGGSDTGEIVTFEA